MNRRALLIAGGGIAAVGTGISGWRILNNQDGVLGNGNGDVGEPDGDFEPQDNLPGEDERTEVGERDNVWNTDSLTVDFTITEEYRENAHFEVEPNLQKAVNYWNEYISENENFTLELSVQEGASDPDILLNHDMDEELAEDSCFEYDNLSDLNPEIIPMACVHTVTEHPENTPVSATISLCGSSYSIYEHVMKHVLGRLIGYDAMDAPRDVMGVKHMAWPYNLVMSGVDFTYEIAVEEYLVNFTGGLWEDAQQEDWLNMSDMQAVYNLLEEGLDEYFEELNEFIEDHIEPANLTGYVEAIDETVYNGSEVQLIAEAIEVMDEWFDAVEELEPDDERDLLEYRAVEETLDELLVNGPDEYAQWALRAHLHWSEQMWNEHFE